LADAAITRVWAKRQPQNQMPLVDVLDKRRKTQDARRKTQEQQQIV
jgi:hypothetical protein